MQHVFVYGTLLFTGIVHGLTGRNFESEPATLVNYQRKLVSNRDYPAIVEAPGEQVSGRLLLNVDARSLEILRFYEGEDYDCQTLYVQIKNRDIKAWVFVWNGGAEALTEQDWNANVFEKQDLPDYIKYVIPDTVAEFTRLFS